MLEKLLVEIKNSGTTSPVMLAKRLDTSTAMVQAMLETLEQQGFLQTMVSDCDSEKPCESCSLSNLCNFKNSEKPRIRTYQENLKKA